jgi:hypothetical protein
MIIFFSNIRYYDDWRKSVVADKSEAANEEVTENWDDDAGEEDWDKPQPGYNPQAKILNSNQHLL